MAKAKRKKPVPIPIRDYIWEQHEDKIYCFRSTNSRCVVFNLAEAGRSEFHNVELQTATRQINGILNRVNKANPDLTRDLALIDVKGRLMLVWTHQRELVGGEDDDRKVAKAFRLKGTWPR